MKKLRILNFYKEVFKLVKKMEMEKMTFKDLIHLWKSDLKIYLENSGGYTSSALRIFITIPGFKYSFYMRLCYFLKHSKHHRFLLPLLIFFRIILKHNEYKFGIQIPFTTKIGPGFYIGHYNGIVVHPEAVIGSNVSIMQGVTIGVGPGGVPIIKDYVWLAAGAKVIGDVTVGNNSVAGANSVITKDVPDNGIAVGVPARVISLKGNK